MQDWLVAGGCIKGEWAAMLEGLRAASREPVKIPFVPVRVPGRALRAVLEDALPMLLGENPSLLTVILEDGKAVKAYAEDASRGVYEELVRLPVKEGDGRAEIRDLARAAGVEPGIVKEAEAGFFELFTREPEELLDALALLVSGTAEALRAGLLRFDPPLPAAELAKAVRLGRRPLKWIMSRLLPRGRYGLGLSCTAGSEALVLEVGAEGWSVGCGNSAGPRADAETSTASGLVRELVDHAGCGAALALRLPALRRLVCGGLTTPEFLRGRGEHWDVETRSGLEGLVAAVSRMADLFGIERDLEECNISFESVLELGLDYLRSAARYVREKGLALKLTDGEQSANILLDAEGVKEAGFRPRRDQSSRGPDQDTPVAEPNEVRGEGEPEAAQLDADDPRLTVIDTSLVRRAVSFLCSDPLAGVRELVPHEVTGGVSYGTAVALVECRRTPKLPAGGRLLLFGGPHQFFNRAWEGDSCAVFVERDGSLHVAELPSVPLAIEPLATHDGRRVTLSCPAEAGGVEADLRFRRVRSRRDHHGAGRLLGPTRLAEWLPGLVITRGLFGLASGRADFQGRELEFDRGWMYLEEGRGRLLHWPFGSTWHYASWLFPSGGCGSGVHAAPMLGRSTPTWWKRALRRAVDGAVFLGEDRAGASEFESALDPGPPARLVRDAARAGGIDLHYQVLSAALVPFDEDGQMIFRLRCLVSDGRVEGAGLVEIPAGLPGTPSEARECSVVFTEAGVSCLVGGRELLLVASDGPPRFLSPYAPPEPGLFRRLARSARLAFRGR